MHLCESCRRNTELLYSRSFDQYLCEDCTVIAMEEYLRSRKRDDEAAMEEAAYECSKEYFDRYIAGDR